HRDLPTRPPHSRLAWTFRSRGRPGGTCRSRGVRLGSLTVSETETLLWVVSCVLGLLLGIAGYVVVRLINEMVYVRDELQITSDVEHAKCMAAVMAFVGDEFASQILDTAATDYASVESEED